MLCQFCQKNEADRTYVTNWVETRFIVHVCEKCLGSIWQQAVSSGHADAFRAISGWWPGKENPRENGECPFPQDVSDDIKLRLRREALRHRLEEAVEQEDYMQAAQLKDQLAELEKEEAYSREL